MSNTFFSTTSIHGIEVDAKVSITYGSPDPDYTEDDLTLEEVTIDGMDAEAFLKSWLLPDPILKGCRVSAYDLVYMEALSNK